MKYIFFVLTFGSIYDRVLPLIEEKKDEGEIIVVATTAQIEKFFKNYTDFKVIRTKVHPNLITRKTKHKILSNIIRSKLEFRKLFKDIKDSEHLEDFFLAQIYPKEMLAKKKINNLR